MSERFTEYLQEQLVTIQQEGLYKSERVITSPQQAVIDVGGRQVINLCANNYLGLANHPTLIDAAEQALEQY